MPRSAEYIADFIKSRIAAKANISTLASNPDYENSIIGQFIECISEVIAEHEEVGQDHMDAVDERIDIINPHTAAWVREKALLFQYSSSDPQHLELVDGIVGYPVVDESLRIVKRCPVRTGTNGVCEIFPTKEDVPEKLSDEEIGAITGYFNSMTSPSFGVAGGEVVVTSTDPDRCFIEAEIFYDPLYATGIETSVITAIKEYLYYPSDQGNILLSDLVETILGVEGVKDVVIKNLAVRADGDLFASATYIVQNFVNGQLRPDSTAGYYYTENEPGEEIENKLTFTAL